MDWPRAWRGRVPSLVRKALPLDPHGQRRVALVPGSDGHYVRLDLFEHLAVPDRALALVIGQLKIQD